VKRVKVGHWTANETADVRASDQAGATDGERL